MIPAERLDELNDDMNAMHPKMRPSIIYVLHVLWFTVSAGITWLTWSAIPEVSLNVV